MILESTFRHLQATTGNFLIEMQRIYTISKYAEGPVAKAFGSLRPGPLLMLQQRKKHASIPEPNFVETHRVYNLCTNRFSNPY